MALATKPAVAVALCSALWGLSSCQRLNPQYCEGAEHNRCPTDGSTTDGSGAPRCTSNSECSSPQAVCDLGDTGTCVQCTVTSASACVGPAPVCADRMCRACIAHTECPASNVCLPAGACANAADVAYVRGDGSGPACTQGQPCRTLRDALSARRPFVKIEAGTVAESGSLFVREPVTILADPGARLVLESGELNVEDDELAIFDLEITGPATESALVFVLAGTTLALTRVKLLPLEGDGLRINDGSATITESRFIGMFGTGISVGNGSLTITRSFIMNNLTGGIVLGAGVDGFVIVGNVFIGNGLSLFPSGALHVEAATTGSRLEFNSFAGNRSVPGSSGTSIHCNGTFTARNNIMSDIGLPGGPHVSGSCTHAYSVVWPGALPEGTGNLAEDPQFLDPAIGNLHLPSTSPARRSADPASDLTGPAARDIDGEPRVAPADIGADQVRP